SRSIIRCAFDEATCGLTESSLTRSIFRPRTPPDALISSAAILMPITAYSPSAPRKPVSGVRWPMRIASDCAVTMPGKPSVAMPAAAAPPCRWRRRTGDVPAGRGLLLSMLIGGLLLDAAFPACSVHLDVRGLDDRGPALGLFGVALRRLLRRASQRHQA